MQCGGNEEAKKKPTRKKQYAQEHTVGIRIREAGNDNLGVGRELPIFGERVQHSLLQTAAAHRSELVVVDDFNHLKQIEIQKNNNDSMERGKVHTSPGTATMYN